MLDCNEILAKDPIKFQLRKSWRSFTFDDQVIILNASLCELNDSRTRKLGMYEIYPYEPKPTKSEQRTDVSLRENTYARVSTEEKKGGE